MKKDEKLDNVEKNKGGHPPIFKTPELLHEKIEEYINNCPDTRTHYTADGTPYEVKIPTVSGMAYFLGFKSRQSMYDYEKRSDYFSYVIMRARLWVEKNYEQLAQGKNANGVIFILKNMGWVDKRELDVNANVTNKTEKDQIDEAIGVLE